MAEIKKIPKEIMQTELEQMITVKPKEPEKFSGQKTIKWRYRPDSYELEIAPSASIITGSNKGSICGTFVFEQGNNRLDIGGERLTDIEKSVIKTKIEHYFNQ